MTPVNPSEFDRYITAIEREYGKGTIRRGTDDPDVSFISTGSHELDLICGGGIPRGRFTRLYGGYSSAKSLTAWNVTKNAHAIKTATSPKGLEVIYYNLEKQYDRKYVAGLGVDVKRLRVVDAHTIEECGTMLYELLNVAHVHIIDSCSAVPSVDELNRTLEERTMGLHPKVWGQVLRRILQASDKKEHSIIMVDQIRDVFGSGIQAPPGGRQMEHVSSLSLMFRRGKWLHKDANGLLDPDAPAAKALGEANDPRGMEIQVRCEKSRVGRPLRTARLRLDLKTGAWDLDYELLKAAIYFDEDGEPAQESGKNAIIEVTGPGRYVMADGTKIHGRKKLREALVKDDALRLRVIAAMRLAA